MNAVRLLFNPARSVETRSSSLLSFFATSRSCVNTATRNRKSPERPQSFFFFTIDLRDADFYSFEMVWSRAWGREEESGGRAHVPASTQFLTYISVFNTSGYFRDTLSKPSRVRAGSLAPTRIGRPRYELGFPTKAMFERQKYWIFSNQYAVMFFLPEEKICIQGAPPTGGYMWPPKDEASTHLAIDKIWRTPKSLGLIAKSHVRGSILPIIFRRRAARRTDARMKFDTLQDSRRAIHIVPREISREDEPRLWYNTSSKMDKCTNSVSKEQDLLKEYQ